MMTFTNLNPMKHLIPVIKKTQVIVLFLSILAIVIVEIAGRDKGEDDRLPISLKAIKTSVGWGYEIAVDGKTFIRQSTLPAVDGNIPFFTREEALFVGTQAMAKLKAGKMPQITTAELKEWGYLKNNNRTGNF